MAKDDLPRLCGGIFFNVILKALRPKSTASEHYKGVNDGLDQQSVLIALVNIFAQGSVSAKSASFKTQTSEYRNFKKASGTNLPFDDLALIDDFNRRVLNDYEKELAAMTSFTVIFLREEKYRWLVKALLELIEGDCGDGGIDSTQPFYCLENGKTVSKSKLTQLTDVCLPAFLLGIWHFIILNRRDNKPGDAGLNLDTIGKNIKRTITVTIPEIDNTIENVSDNTVHENEPVEEQYSEQGEPYIDIETAAPPKQTVNQIILTQNIGTIQSGGLNIGFVGQLVQK